MGGDFYKFIGDTDRVKELLTEARGMADNIYVDILDCAVSFARQKSDKTFEEVLDMWDDKEMFRHFVFILRDRSFSTSSGEACIETGIRVGQFDAERGRKVDFFIFIELDKKHLNYFLDKYKLKLL